MFPPHLLNSPRSFIRRSRLLQIALLIGFWWIGTLICDATALPIPGGILGMGLVLALLSTGKLSLLTVRRGAEWLIAEMLLFFVPAVLSVLDHQDLLGLLGLKILIVITMSTLAVMAATAFTVDLCYRWRSKHAVCALVE